MNRTLPNRTILHREDFQPSRFRSTGFQPVSVPAGSRHSVAAAGSRHDGSGTRRGSVIIVVIGLLGALMLLGFLFLTLSLQEEESARYYSEAQKVTESDPNAFFNWGLEQLLLGAPDDRKDSVLWGGRAALLPNMFGSDMVPYDGPGVNLLIDPIPPASSIDLPTTRVPQLGPDAHIPFVDQDMNGVPDGLAAQTYGWLNVSPGSLLAADQSLVAVPPPPATPTLEDRVYDVRSFWPEPDAGYTYPDVNSPFLHYETASLTATNPSVLIPSFHRPQLLRGRTARYDYRGGGTRPSDWYNPTDWYTNAATLPYVFRPHAERRAVAVNPSDANAFVVLTGAGAHRRRLVTGGVRADGTVIGYPDVDQNDVPVDPDDPTFVPPFTGGTFDTDGDGTADKTWADLLNLASEGQWRYTEDGAGVPQIANAYDGDPDNDGVADAVWLDLGYPAQGTAGGGLFVPLHLVKLVDGDALFNLNAHGNVYGDVTNLGGNLLSRSNEGLGPHEVNPQYGLTATPSGAPTVEEAEALEPSRDVFGAVPGSRLELANMEWWFALAGQGVDNADPAVANDDFFETVRAGRFGEPRVLADALNFKGAGLAPAGLAAFPRPGLTGRVARDTYADDDGDALAGLQNASVDPSGLVFPAGVGTSADGHPTDRRGQGRYVAPTGGDRLFAGVGSTGTLQLPAPTDQVNGIRFRFPAFVDYWLPMLDPNIDPPPNPPFVLPNVGPLWARVLLGTGNTPLTQAVAFAKFYSGLIGDGDPDTFEYAQFLNLDEPDETVLDFREARKQGSDQIFDPSETAALQLSDADREITDVGGRVADLLPYNFTAADDAEAIRGRYTSASFDLHAAAPTDASPPTGGAVDARPAGLRTREWEFNQPAADGGVAGVREFPPSFGPTSVPPAPPARYTPYWSDAEFGDGTRLGLANNTAGPFDPYREEVRALLRSSQVPAGSPGRRELSRGLFRKLSVNHVLERVTNPNDPHYDTDNRIGELRFRTLTPHPATLGAARVPAPGSLAGNAAPGATPAFPVFGIPDAALGRLEAADDPNTPSGYTTWAVDIRQAPGDRSRPVDAAKAAAAQEWHARRDRQNMARDIYVLLWTLGGFDETTPDRDYTASNAGRALYTELEMREMAQFAVNLVDALDPDGVMTVFVYDKDLSKGYTTADDGYSNPLPMPGDRAFDRAATDPDRGMVVGVERQDLVLGEAMFTVAWGSEDRPGGREFYDHKLTEWDDRKVEDFSFIEVANVGPDAVNFADANNPEQWQIVVRPPTVPDAADPQVLTRTLVPTAGSLTPDRPYHVFAASNTGANVDGAGNQRPARLRVNLSDTEDENSVSQNFPHHIAPYHFVNPGPDQNGRDLMTQDGYRLFDEGGNELSPGDREQRSTQFVEFIKLTADASKPPPDTLELPTVEVLLQRRLNPRRGVPNRATAGEVEDNPWVTVDSLRVKPRKLDAREEADNDKTTGDGEFQATFIPGTQAGESVPNNGPIARVRRRPLLRASELAVDSRAAGQQSTAGGPAVVPGPPTRSLSRYVSNSLGGHDALSPNTFTLWQPHGDRPFGSLADVLRVPLYPPSRLAGLPLETDPLYSAADALAHDYELPTGNARQCGAGVSTAPAAPATLPTLNRSTVAADRFLFPDRARGAWPQTEPRAAGAIGTSGRNRSRFNLWWRLFQFAEPARHEAEMTQTPGFAVRVGPTDRVRQNGPGSDDLFATGHSRTAGRMNLNTIRDPRHLAGLLDDPTVSHGVPTDFRLAASNNRSPDTTTVPGLPSGDWWISLVRSRDGLDPLLGAAGPDVVLPGLPPRLAGGALQSGLPFRSPGSLRWEVPPMAAAAEGLRRNFVESPLRRIVPGPADPPPATASPFERGLFALDNAALEPAPAADFDFTTRYRLLGKLLNNTSVRSNVFLCWIQVDFFHARRLRVDGNGNLDADGNFELTRIGNIRDDSPSYRGFFVIDRSRAMDLIEKKHLPDGAGTKADPRTYSFRRDSLSGGPRFPWQELILYRRLIQ